MPQETWHDYLAKLTQSGAENSWVPEEYLTRLKTWQNRFAFYEEIYNEVEDKRFKKVIAWRRKNQLRRQGEKLKKALIALKELKDNKEKILTSSNTSDLATQRIHYKQMKTITSEVIDVQLTKLELTQLKMLSKAQNLRRRLDNQTLEDKRTELNELRHKLRLDIENESYRYSSRANSHDLTNTSTFFKQHERKIHFNKHFKRSDRAADTISVFSAINNFFAHVAQLSAPFGNALLAAGHVLLAVPFISSIVAAITIFIHAAKMWLQNKSLTKRALAGILVGVVVGGLITLGLGTLAAAIVAVGLMTIGAIVKHIHPWAKYAHGIYQRKKELTELKQTHAIFKKTMDPNKITLTQRERQFLMVKAEEAYLKASSLRKQGSTEFGEIPAFAGMTNFSVVKDAILNDSFSQLNGNPEIKKLLPENQNLKDFLSEQMGQREQDLIDEKKIISALEKRKRIVMASSIVAIIGATLLCIPTPATMIIGASLLVMTAVVGVVVNFNLDIKIKNGIKKLIAKARQSTPSEEPNTITPQNTLKNKLIHTSLDDLKYTIRLERPSFADEPEELRQKLSQAEKKTEIESVKAVEEKPQPHDEEGEGEGEAPKKQLKND